ncbi:hypothetical protein [Amycolatopsis sp. cg9]|uniref:hypothetical protein n=1 Tax=Amycolatopsis sp. cg9 TaxID=3238801 RepID=UPI0035240F0A
MEFTLRAQELRPAAHSFFPLPSDCHQRFTPGQLAEAFLVVRQLGWVALMPAHVVPALRIRIGNHG